MNYDSADKITASLERDYLKTLNDQYQVALDDVNDRINKIYLKYGSNDGTLPMDVMQKMAVKDQKELTRLQKLFSDIDEDLAVLNRGRQQQLSGYLTDVYVDNYDDVSKKLTELTGTSFKTLNREAIYKSAISPLGTEAHSALTTAINQNIRRSITTSIVQGESIQKMSKRIKDDLETNANNAVKIARTETTRIMGEARLSTLQQVQDQGTIVQKQWIATKDNRTRDRHAQMHNELADLDKPFSNGLMYPSDPSGIGSETVNCRCTMVSFMPEYETPEQVGLKPEDLQPKLRKITPIPTPTPVPDRRANDFKRTATPENTKQTLKKTQSQMDQKIQGKYAGNPMTHKEADSGNANPLYMSGKGYNTNCQTCVVSYEARLRGHDVMAVANFNNTTTKALSRQTNLAWINQKTNTYVDYIVEKSTIYTPKKYYQYANSVIEMDKRYTIEFFWKGRSRSGHIVSISKDANGILQMYDPQIDRMYTGNQVNDYMERMKFKTTVYGTNIPTPPKIMRIDNALFNEKIIDNILVNKR